MLKLILRLLHSVFRTRRALFLENAALRHQIEVLRRNATRPALCGRDRDGKFCHEFNRRVSSLEIEQILTSPHSPWQNPYVERVTGSIRRECLDQVIIFNEQNPRSVLRKYLDHYHRSRTHPGLEKDCPEPRVTEPIDIGPVASEPVLGGLHHRYFRQAA